MGCPRNCAEATVKDIGLVGQEGSWQVVVGGAAGKSVRKADLLITVETTEAGARSLRAVLPVLPRERAITWSAPTISWSAWIENIRKETVYAPDGRKKSCSTACSVRKLREGCLAGARSAGASHAVRTNPSRWRAADSHDRAERHWTPHHGHRKYSAARRPRRFESAGWNRRSSISTAAS